MHPDQQYQKGADSNIGGQAEEDSAMEEMEVLSDPKPVPEKDSSPPHKSVESQGNGAHLVRYDHHYNALGEENVKPRLSYASLIAMALRDFGGYGTLSEIYKV